MTLNKVSRTRLPYAYNYPQKWIFTDFQININTNLTKTLRDNATSIHEFTITAEKTEGPAQKSFQNDSQQSIENASSLCVQLSTEMDIYRLSNKYKYQLDKNLT
ncbi:hypothetical protein Glove_23g217 [Diversispora epigaea]|uniref:Uncharacterized protein n=1 Tax=Diversispora epigaea TaxID=1348612 RepID=A0A397JJZ8_9GLOM|nr:hypothetical protein Glove_23g217 [Diversispora epigaea]